MLKAILLLLVMTGCASPDRRLHRVDRMFERNEPFSFELLYGSRKTYKAVQAAEKIEVYRLDPEHRAPSKQARGRDVLKGPVELAGPQKKKIRDLLVSGDSFFSRPLCAPLPGILMTVTSGKTYVDFDFCFECDLIIIESNDDHDVAVVSMTKKSLEPFLLTFQSLFPEDEELKKIQIK